MQRALVRHLHQRLAPPWMFFHVPNGGGRSKGEGGVFKALGVRAGIPDLILIGDGRMVCLECKADKGRLTPKQRETIAAFADAGAPTMIVRSVDQALEALAAMNVPMRGRVM